MYHHLKQHDDFEVVEINNSSLQAVEVSVLRRVINAFYRRISRTRWHRWAKGYEQLWRHQKLPQKLLKSVRQFKPDVVLTVAHGNLFWLAHKVARQLQIPLVSIYHDWWPMLLQQSYSLKVADAEEVSRRFQQLHAQSDRVLCISDGMRQALGCSPNAYVLYPTASAQLESVTQVARPDERFSVLYSGNVAASYGKKLRSLIHTRPADNPIQLVIHGNPYDWPEAVVNSARQQGIVQPFVASSHFSQTLSQASAFLAVVSFDPAVAQLMSTNFPSKIATYAVFGKPLIVWAPAYSTAAQLVRQHECGLLVEDADPNVFWQAVLALSQDPAQQQQFAEKALRLHKEVLHPDVVHQTFVQHIQAVCDAAPA